jgi:aspartate aminotransferase
MPLGVDARASSIRVSPIRIIASLIAQARAAGDVISLGGGSPGAAPPDVVIEAIQNRLRDGGGVFGYGETRGALSVRESFARSLKEDANWDVDPEEEVILTDGSQEALFLATQALISPGDDVIILEPSYVGFEPLVRYAGGRPIYFAQRPEDGYQPDVERLGEIITRRTKMLILATPDNPTGRMLREEVLRAMVELAKDRSFYLLIDQAYRKIVYEGSHTYPSRFDPEGRVVISTFTISKEVSLPGARLGFLVGPREVVEAAEKIKQLVTLMPNTLGQIAAQTYYSWSGRHSYIRDHVIPLYKARRDEMERALREHLPRARFVKPQGAFYYFVDVSDYLTPGMAERDYYRELLEEERVVVIPGSFFGGSGRGHIRLTFVTEPPDRLREGVARISRFYAKRLDLTHRG